MQLAKIAIIEKPTDHIRWDLACALLARRLPGRGLKVAICAHQRSHGTRMEKAWDSITTALEAPLG